jgi:hypothetical protein
VLSDCVGRDVVNATAVAFLKGLRAARTASKLLSTSTRSGE